jgi:hypothetical protein
MNGHDPIRQTNPKSNRSAIFEDNGVSAWLYLTRPHSLQPECDCWIYNRIAPPNPSEVKNYHGGPPPACAGYADAADTFTDPAHAEMSFIWSKTGNDVAVKINGRVLSFISSQLTAGYSKLLLRDGPWGRIWKESIYSALFDIDD